MSENLCIKWEGKFFWSYTGIFPASFHAAPVGSLQEDARWGAALPQGLLQVLYVPSWHITCAIISVMRQKSRTGDSVHRFKMLEQWGFLFWKSCLQTLGMKPGDLCVLIKNNFKTETLQFDSTSDKLECCVSEQRTASFETPQAAGCSGLTVGCNFITLAICNLTDRCQVPSFLLS